MRIRIAVIIFMSFLIWKPSFAQKADPNITIDKNLKKYKNMKHGGLVLIITGGVLMVTGGIIEANQIGESVDPFSSSHDEEYNPTGSILFVAGVAMAGGGIPLLIIGNKKYKKYKNNPDVISLGIKSTRRSTGLSLTYRF